MTTRKVRLSESRLFQCYWDKEQNIIWQTMFPPGFQGIPCFSFDLMNEMTATQDVIMNILESESVKPEAIVLTSAYPGVFCLGGDLHEFRGAINSGNRDRLRAYAHQCVAWQLGVFSITLRYRGVKTFALVQGDAFGGGFEGALSHWGIIAEESAKFSLPEPIFKLFAGMGAYTFLRNRVGRERAVAMLDDPRRYSAQEMRDLGIVNYIVPDDVLRDHVVKIIKEAPQPRLRLMPDQFTEAALDLVEQELYRVTDEWVDQASSLNRRDPEAFATMGRLAKIQRRAFQKKHNHNKK